ncbi:FecR family protein [Paraflavitalea sp. CAU 1676]|uniref:FecR family protein n=1 Tax=Paraflavitalea sp. CAU 1676 TaxID=3032598 RepID=UPI0023DC2975|nr:FecR family protein [Paraflavitalea sp. CAU 1676]MDF2188499.1 FecR family protein [Paraflavitalea sp. CAU 1676]
MAEQMQLDQLIIKYLTGELSETERVFLFSWRDSSAGNQSTFDRLTNTEWLGQQLELMVAADKEAAWSRFQSEQAANQATVIPLRPRRRYYWAAAIAAALVIGIGYWYVSRPDIPQPLSQVERFRNDVPPGQEGAVLTTADGAKVLLDSVTDGRIPVKEKAVMIKEGGQLSYQAPANAATVYHTLTTPKGRKFRLRLADGTVALLNAESSITFPTAFPGAAREVTTTGEVYFEVAKNNKPFLAKTQLLEVKVMGTHFNVNSYTNNGQTRITLAEGAVQVAGIAATIENKVRLSPGEAAILNSNSGRIVTQKADLEEALAWTNNLFSFNNAGIEEVMRQLERWYDIEVVYQQTPNLHFSGSIPMNVNISTALKVLELTKGVTFIVDGRKVIVMGS